MADMGAVSQPADETTTEETTAEDTTAADKAAADKATADKAAAEEAKEKDATDDDKESATMITSAIATISAIAMIAYWDHLLDYMNIFSFI